MSITNPTPEERAEAVESAENSRDAMLVIFGTEEPPSETNPPDPTLGQKVVDACQALIDQWS